MATIRKRGNTYQVQIRKLGFPAKNKTFSTKADAETWAKTTESAMERGEWHDNVVADATTLAMALLDYRNDYVPKKLRSVEATQDRIDKIILRWPVTEKVAMSRIEPALFKDYIAMREKDKVSGSTINRELSIISSAITRAIRSGLRIDNPIKIIDRPKNAEGRSRRLRKGELKSILNELRPRQRDSQGQLREGVDNPFVRWMVLFAIETAMRRGEILDLTWSNIRLNERVAHLPKTKNGESRDVPLSKFARRILCIVRKLTDDDRVFKATPDALKKCWSRAVKRAGIDDLRFHDLRHEGTSRLALKFNMLELSSITGHKDPRMLKKYYHPDAADLAKRLN